MNDIAIQDKLLAKFKPFLEATTTRWYLVLVILVVIFGFFADICFRHNYALSSIFGFRLDFGTKVIKLGRFLFVIRIGDDYKYGR